MIRPVFHIQRNIGSPASLVFRARATSADIDCQRADVTPAGVANQPGHSTNLDDNPKADPSARFTDARQQIVAATAFLRSEPFLIS